MMVDVKIQPFLDQLKDVTITSPVDNEILSFDTSSGLWINQTPSEAGLDSIYLKLDGSNANTTINIGSENLTTTGDVSATTLTSPTVADHPHQDVQTTASPIFVNPEVQQLHFNSNAAVLTSSSGNELILDVNTLRLQGSLNNNLITTGDGTFDELTITNGIQNFKFLGASALANSMAWQGQTSGASTRFGLYSKDGDGTDNVLLDIYGVGRPEDLTGINNLILGYLNTGVMIVRSSTNEVQLRSGTGLDHIQLKLDKSTVFPAGKVSITNGNLDVTENITADSINVTDGYVNGSQFVSAINLSTLMTYQSERGTVVSNQYWAWGNGQIVEGGVVLKSGKVTGFGVSCGVVGTTLTMSIHKNGVDTACDLTVGNSANTAYSVGCNIDFAEDDILGFHADVETGTYTTCVATAIVEIPFGQVSGLKGDTGEVSSSPPTVNDLGICIFNGTSGDIIRNANISIIGGDTFTHNGSTIQLAQSGIINLSASGTSFAMGGGGEIFITTENEAVMFLDSSVFVDYGLTANTLSANNGFTGSCSSVSYVGGIAISCND